MLLSEADWQAIQSRAALPAFATVIQRLRQEVADALAQPVNVPTAPGGYYHDYFCPEHGVQLHFDPALPQTHRCPVDDAIWEGESFDAAWRWFVNNRLAESTFRFALLWRLEGKGEHLVPVVRTLTGYAAQYAAYGTVPRTVANPGVATYTTLDESVWVLPLVWAFEMIRDQLTPAERTAIAEDLFAPVAAHLVAHHFQGIHNFACWHNAAIATIGVVINRDDLIAFAMDSDFGCYSQLQQGVLADGLWYEGSFSYHFYTVYALLMLAKALRHQPGYDLRQRPELHAMLLAPIQSAYPDWSLPAPNDCWYFTSLLHDCCHGVPQGPAFYEIGYGWYDDPRFGQLLQRAYQEGARDSLDALIFGRAALPVTPLAPLASVNLPASGYAILRERLAVPTAANAEQTQRYLLLKYGPHGGGHGHPDKLNLLVYAYGQRMAPDLGTPGYGLDLFQSWYRQTVSHNTVTLDGHSQPEGAGQLYKFQDAGPFQIADASIHWTDEGPYQGVTLRRVILARPTYFLDLFLVEAPQPRRIDWLYHNIGTLYTLLPVTPYPAIGTEGEGYAHIHHAQQGQTASNFTATWRMVEGGIQLWSAGGAATDVITGTVPSNPPTATLATLLQRQRGTTATFLTLFHPFQAAPTITHVHWLGNSLAQNGWAGCQVMVDGQLETWLIQAQATVAPPAWFTERPVAARFNYTLEQ